MPKRVRQRLTARGARRGDGHHLGIRHPRERLGVEMPDKPGADDADFHPIRVRHRRHPPTSLSATRDTPQADPSEEEPIIVSVAAEVADEEGLGRSAHGLSGAGVFQHFEECARGRTARITPSRQRACSRSPQRSASYFSDGLGRLALDILGCLIDEAGGELPQHTFALGPLPIELLQALQIPRGDDRRHRDPAFRHEDCGPRVGRPG